MNDWDLYTSWNVSNEYISFVRFETTSKSNLTWYKCS
jgi:hypothetical protein